MQNVEMSVEGKTLVIRVDLTKRLGPSSSGKTEIVGTTAGAAKVKGPGGADISVGLNVFTKPKAK